ncbi:hypothetical protein Rsub_03053 [Raphidocelis subcapitata]|uniref:Patatin n=1 Tax=Raphidocelis subcapitata TaxID=307507 RepID=A0A2V0NVP8_9CHLO|nr:hypothetical protein Rsub_03053 [Raphidocelis subcapitata]|eukprot:GBF90752.1 hypothetical protein Rsub_03053 [Raphidocelis subcapitata]
MASPALLAAQAGSIGAGFSGGGFILPFLLGVIDMLYRDLGVMNADMPVAGASAGSIAAATAIGLVPLGDVRSEVDSLGARCRAKGNCYGTLYDEVQRSARRILVRDAGNKMAAHGRAYFAVVHPASVSGASAPRQELVSSFKGRDDIANAIAASCYIPGYAGPSPTIKFRGQRVYDGGFGGPGAGFLPCPPDVRYCVRVSSMPGGITMPSILLDVLLGGPYNQALAVGAALSTLGGADVLGTLTKQVLGGGGGGGGGGETQQLADMASAMAAFMQFKTPGEGEADIFPGRRHALPVGEFEWVTRMAVPASAADNQAMFDLGRAEALSWAQEAGFPAALAKAGRSG